MDCQTAYAVMHEFLDGALSPERQRDFEAHVAGCPKCAREIRAYRSIDRLLGRMEAESAPPGFAEPIIRFLKATGRIRETAAGARAPRRGLAGWLPEPLRVPAAAALVIFVALSAISIASGRFLGFVGKSTVAATTAYIDVQETVSSVTVLDGVSREFEQDVRTAKTIMNALYLLLSAAGRTYLLPALSMLLVFAMCALWYVRTSLKRSTGHASFCF
jgi:anti-sigma factor (TIGR02949 family)